MYFEVSLSSQIQMLLHCFDAAVKKTKYFEDRTALRFYNILASSGISKYTTCATLSH